MEDFLSQFSLISGALPETLYHYTAQTGLLGIIREGEIWMTHTQYLNDTQEFYHAVGLVESELTRRKKETTNEVEKRVLGEMLERARHDLGDINVCVCCFSEDGDSLSQWRAYGGSMSGYSIGFCGSFLGEIAKRENYLLARCIYDPERQRAIVEEFVDTMLREIMDHNHLTPDDEEYVFWHQGGNLVPYLNRLAPVLKNWSFRHEREWRIISRPLSCANARFDYRPGRSMIIPFHRLSITNDAEHAGTKRFRKIFVGPTPNKQQAMASVRSLLASQRLASNLTPGGPVLVDNSSVPFRPW